MIAAALVPITPAAANISPRRRAFGTVIAPATAVMVMVTIIAARVKASRKCDGDKSQRQRRDDKIFHAPYMGSAVYPANKRGVKAC
jgi:hypothetical protein